MCEVMFGGIHLQKLNVSGLKKNPERLNVLLSHTGVYDLKGNNVVLVFVF